MSTIYRLISNKELSFWKENNINNVYNSVQNEGLIIPKNIHKNYKNNIPCGLCFYYKLEQILTNSLYQPNAYCIISLEIPEHVLKKYATVGYYFGYISNGMKTAYEYLIPKEILKNYINSFKVICDNNLALNNLIDEFRLQDDNKDVIKKFVDWPERNLGLNNSSKQGDIEWLLENFFGVKFTQVINGLFFPSESYILNNKEKFNFSDKNIGYLILKEAINDPTYFNLNDSNDQFVIPHPKYSVFGYLGKHLIEEGYESFKELFNKKDELLKYYIDSANQTFNNLYKNRKY